MATTQVKLWNTKTNKDTLKWRVKAGIVFQDLPETIADHELRLERQADSVTNSVTTLTLLVKGNYNGLVHEMQWFLYQMQTEQIKCP